MISKKYRLREHEVARVFKKGKPFFGAYWIMNCFEDRRGKNHRIAVSISRKHDKRAVARNRYRRGLYDGLLPSLKFGVLSGKNVTVDSAADGSGAQNGKLKTENFFTCVFTLKKGLKILEKKIPESWIMDAQHLFSKCSKNK